jgi:hypothetical protein
MTASDDAAPPEIGELICFRKTMMIDAFHNSNSS